MPLGVEMKVKQTLQQNKVEYSKLFNARTLMKMNQQKRNASSKVDY